MASLTAIQRRVEMGRFYVDAELTEDGVYIKGEIPESYSGIFIAQIEVCYALVATDISGRILMSTFNPPELADKDDKTGLQIVDPQGREVRPKGTDGGDTVITLSWRENDYLPEEFKIHVDNMWEVAQREMGEWYV